MKEKCVDFDNEVKAIVTQKMIQNYEFPNNLTDKLE